MFSFTSFTAGHIPGSNRRRHAPTVHLPTAHCVKSWNKNIFTLTEWIPVICDCLINNFITESLDISAWKNYIIQVDLLSPNCPLQNFTMLGRDHTCPCRVTIPQTRSMHRCPTSRWAAGCADWRAGRAWPGAAAWPDLSGLWLAAPQSLPCSPAAGHSGSRRGCGAESRSGRVGQPAGLAHHRPVQSQARLAGSHVVVFNFGFTSVMNVMKNFDPCGQRTAYILFYTQYKIVMLSNTNFFK